MMGNTKVGILDENLNPFSKTNTLPISNDEDFFLNISRGKYTNLSTQFKFGRHQSLAATEHVIWDGESNYTFLSAAEPLSIVSTDAADNSTGLGARTLIVYGLDSNYNEISELITLNGTTPVITTKSYLRTFRALVVTSGTNNPVTDANLGTITFTTTSTSTLQAKIGINNGQTLMCVYTVPANKSGFVTGVGASLGSGKSAYLKFKARNTTLENNGAFSVKYTLDMYQATISQQLVTPFYIPEKTDIVITGVSSAGTAISASFGMILVNNT